MKKSVLIFAVILGVIGILILWLWSNKFKKMHSLGETAKVLVAGRNIKPGIPLKKKWIRVKKMPKRFLHNMAVLYSEAVMIIGNQPLYSIEKGDVLLWTDFKGGGYGKKLSELLGQKERAFTLSVDRISAAGGNLLPGDHVDIIGTFMQPDGRQEFTKTIMENVVVLATGTNVGGDMVARTGRRKNRSFSTVSLKVTPREAELLAFSQRKGRLVLSLRHPDDNASLEYVDIPVVNFSDIIKARPKPRPRSKKIKQIRVDQ